MASEITQHVVHGFYVQGVLGKLYQGPHADIVQQLCKYQEVLLSFKLDRYNPTVESLCSEMNACGEDVQKIWKVLTSVSETTFGSSPRDWNRLVILMIVMFDAGLHSPNIFEKMAWIRDFLIEYFNTTLKLTDRDWMQLTEAISIVAHNTCSKEQSSRKPWSKRSKCIVGFLITAAVIGGIATVYGLYKF